MGGVQPLLAPPVSASASIAFRCLGNNRSEQRRSHADDALAQTLVDARVTPGHRRTRPPDPVEGDGGDDRGDHVGVLGAASGPGNRPGSTAVGGGGGGDEEGLCRGVGWGG